MTFAAARHAACVETSPFPDRFLGRMGWPILVWPWCLAIALEILDCLRLVLDGAELIAVSLGGDMYLDTIE